MRVEFSENARVCPLCLPYNLCEEHQNLPLAGASIDAAMTLAVQLADDFVARTNARYSILQRNNPSNGIDWFVEFGAGDFLGRPDNRESPTVRYYNQLDGDGFGAVCTWNGKCVRIAKLSNFLVAYACENMNVDPTLQSVSQLVGTRNSLSGSASWACGVEFAMGARTLEECAGIIANACWDEGDQKVRRLWPNEEPADNFVPADNFHDPDTQFTFPGFLFMEDP